jgi:hypothetical protein
MTVEDAGTRKRGARWRSITAGVLLALAVITIVLGPIMLYVRTQFLDSAAFRDRAETALAAPEVQDYVADAVTANLVARGGPTVERAEPVIRAVVGGVVESERFQAVFGRAAEGLHDRLLAEGTAQRLIDLREGVVRVVDAIAVVSPELAQRIRNASGQIAVGQGTTGKRLAQIAHRADQLRTLAIILPIVAFVLLALAIAVAPNRLRTIRRAGWCLIAGGIVVAAVVGLTRRILLGIVDSEPVRGAVGEAESAFLGDLGTWGAWLVGLGVVVVGVAVFLGSPLTLREHLSRTWAGTTTRPERAWVLVLRILALVVLVLLVIFALDAVLRIAIGVAVGLAVAYCIAELLRLAGVGAQRPAAPAAST